MVYPVAVSLEKFPLPPFNSGIIASVHMNHRLQIPPPAEFNCLATGDLSSMFRMLLLCSEIIILKDFCIGDYMCVVLHVILPRTLMSCACVRM